MTVVSLFNEHFLPFSVFGRIKFQIQDYILNINVDICKNWWNVIKKIKLLGVFL